MKPNYRRCITCRRVSLKQEFWRIIRVFPSGQVQLDQGMGRSAYICPQAGCLQAAQKKNRLGRSLHASVPETLYQTLWQRLELRESQWQEGTPPQNCSLTHPDLGSTDSRLKSGKPEVPPPTALSSLKHCPHQNDSQIYQTKLEPLL